MPSNKNIVNTLIAIGLSIVISLIAVNFIGNPLEKFEIAVYQKITGKKGQHIEIDSLGIPYVLYEGNIGKKYNFIAVAEYAIKISGNEDSLSRKHFFNCIHWLIGEGVVLNDSSFLYENDYDWPGYKMTSPWRSAMNQGRAIQALLKAFEITGDSSWLMYANKSMNTLYTEVQDGGVTYKDEKGYWYEEYADSGAPQSRVLNGMIVVLQGLSDYYKVTGDTSALFLFNKGVEAVKNSISMYDNNGHSNYDILKKPAKAWYHNFHVRLLGFLYDETHDPVFKEYQEKWAKYKEPSYLEKLVQKPSRIGIFTLFSIFTATFIFIQLIVFCFKKLFYPSVFKKY
ncbi:MAG: hypothetical protein H6540_05340 [Bacteroidales bacterium]|nr:hypothetical protein [Bacteroidales bacterium]